MAKSYNRVINCGNLTRDPELKRVGANGTALCEFSLALNESYKDGDEWKEETSFVDYKCWGKRGEAIAQYLKKGSKVLVEGKIKQERWTTKDDENRSRLVVVVSDFSFMDSKQEASDDEHDNPADGFDDPGSTPF